MRTEHKKRVGLIKKGETRVISRERTPSQRRAGEDGSKGHPRLPAKGSPDRSILPSRPNFEGVPRARQGGEKRKTHYRFKPNFGLAVPFAPLTLSLVGP